MEWHRGGGSPPTKKEPPKQQMNIDLKHLQIQGERKGVVKK